MKLLALLLLVCFSAPAKSAPEENPEPSSATVTTPPGPTSEEDVTPQPDSSLGAPPGNLQETVRQTLETFVPSEEIDVDKPVDFPTNI